jgi:hypothetical protein
MFVSRAAEGDAGHTDGLRKEIGFGRARLDPPPQVI